MNVSFFFVHKLLGIKTCESAEGDAQQNQVCSLTPSGKHQSVFHDFSSEAMPES